MPDDIDPVLHNWYRHLDKGQVFRVVAVDETDGTVEVQHFDGDLESLDLDAWYALDIEGIEAPENWWGVMDIAEVDDAGEGITDTAAEDWRAPQEELRHPGERDPLVGEEEADDWDEGAPQEETREREP
jgi:hypothetical protein